MAIPTSLIQIEAHPVECHRVMSNDTDERTGRRVKSVPYGSRAEALEAWASRGVTEADIDTTDARIDSLRELLTELEVAFAGAGSEGVTLALAEREYSQALSRLQGVSIALEETSPSR